MFALPRLAPRLAWIIPIALLIGTACDRNPAAPGVLASLTVSRNPDTLAVGARRQFTAVGTDANGTPVGVKPTWSVAAGGGTVSAAGLFTAGTVPGTFSNSVKATVGSISDQATITVVAGPVATITVTPTSETVVVGATQQFVAVVRDGFGNVLTVAPNWSVAAGGGTITSGGLFTAGPTAGTYLNSVVASVGSISASATVTVTAGTLASITITPRTATLATNATQQFTAAGKDANGNPVAIAPIWSVVASGGSINSTGLFTAGTVAGTFPNTVAATVGSVSSRASVTVSAGVVASITIAPTTQSLTIGSFQQFTAVVKDAVGNVLSTLPTWSVAAGGGTINSTGLFVAGNTAGTFVNTVRATIGGITASATVTVTAGGLATITVTPNAASIAVGGTQQFTAVGKDAAGNSVAITPTWSVVSSGGTIGSTTGLFTGGAIAGTFANTVRACSTAACAGGSVSGFATVTVTPGALATLTVSPNPVAVGTGASQQFTAVGRDAAGNVLATLAAPVWTVAPGHAGGTILNTGLYTAPAVAGVGFDSVRVAIGAIAGVARVNISLSGALASIVVTPNPASVIAGGTTQFTATGFDATGLIVPTPALVWSVVPAVGGGSINGSTGLFSAGLTLGTFTNAVRATSGAVFGFASVTVTAPPAGPSLGVASSYGLLAGSAFSCATGGTISADAGVWPGNVVTGFPPCAITGATQAGTSFAQAAQTDLATAFNALAALPCGTTITADLGGTTLNEGVYCSTTSVGVTGTVTLSGTASSVFVIRATTTLTAAGSVVLTGGAQAKNVYWWVGSSATVGAASVWRGNLLALSSITLANTATLTGRALARTGAVSLGSNNTITLP